MPFLFALTLFLSAALGFLVQPLIARQLLPLAGGSPAVWTTCLVFFQLMLLAGYWYAHVMTERRGGEWIIAQACLFLLGCGILGRSHLAPDAALFERWNLPPVWELMGVLAVCVGLPFFVVSTNAPLLQTWYGRCNRDPYWLYAISNAGSLVGLLSYPFVVEPAFTIAQQRKYWHAGFFALTVLVLVSGFVGFSQKHVDRYPPQFGRPRLPWQQQWKWIALSALTASLLASVTAHLSTDIAPMPLLWVVPLAIYLVTYIVTFGWWPDRARHIMGRVTPMAICFSVVALLTQATEPMVLVAAVHLFGLACVGLLCHGELAASKPGPEHLTSFYLAIALGGVLGGSVNAVLAPMLFAHLGPMEYPLGLVLAALVQARSASKGETEPLLALRACYRIRTSDVAWPLVILAFTLALTVSVPQFLAKPDPNDPGDVLIDRLLRGGLMFGIPVACSFSLVWRPVRFALCLAAVLSVGIAQRTATANTLAVERNFFGTLTVCRVNEFTILTHGTTRHGMQKTDEAPPEPRMYYHRKGPLGRVFQQPGERVGVVGLGCGAMAAYALPGQRWTFFEIDPGVVRVARNERYFTFLKHCQGECDIVLGDARRKLNDVPDGTFDLLAIDAFSSDAVPVHLLTREAFALDLRKLKPNGRLLLHLSNRYLDLPSLAARVVQSIDGSPPVWWDEDGSSDDNEGKSASTWVLVSAKPAKGFTPLRPHAGPVWTDDYAPLRGTWKSED